ncbi:hypothetical protein ciss_21220 [Carboxydothermus islandicus]|uniref:Uncharacterized protein n=1 Tax=Carboxydothermus islandicus TaxID=661089 RepID=A0A1L8D4T1_9THEO|nr:hypothetical protein [Carboxydothermus islandicus]GAV26189.1 hypothetical protein ciss_21220 [Carboxydothermus islandicus]
MKFGSYSFCVALNNILGIIDPELKKFRLRTAFVSLELGKLLSFKKVNLDENRFML